MPKLKKLLFPRRYGSSKKKRSFTGCFSMILNGKRGLCNLSIDYPSLEELKIGNFALSDLSSLEISSKDD